MNKLKKVELFCDGSCLKNPGDGGWAYILRYNGRQKIASGAKANTTNNQMELQAGINGLKALREPCAVVLCTDSSYVVKGINEWLEVWLKNGFKTANKQKVKNADLWLELLEQLKRHEVKAIWIKGHAGHEENELCDKLAKEAATSLACKIS